MRNIPTDLLRAFVTIIDLQGYTRAGEQLGRTQPAISLQMKRLQELLNVQLFVKDGGSKLTEAGEIVASYARQMLSLNDAMLLRLQRRDSGGKLRLGIPNDYADHFLPRLMKGLSPDDSNLSFDVECGISHELLKGLRDDLYDIVIAMTPDGPAQGAFMTWREKLTWVGNGTQIQKVDDPLRIVCYQEGCLYRRSMLTALQREGRQFGLVYVSPSLHGIESAVSTGFGITALAERIVPSKLKPIAAEARLPPLSDVVVGIYINEKSNSEVAKSFAARFADAFVAR